MPYHVTCACGEAFPVDADQAGSIQLCSCGSAVRVPKLSQLRTGAGESAIPRDAVGRINAMIASHEVPSVRVCPLSRQTADAVAYLHVQCDTERGITRETGFLHALMWFALIGPWMVLMERLRPEPGRDEGHDIFIVLPLNIAASARDKLARLSQRRLVRILQTEPAYRELLRQYPKAKITPCERR